MAHLLSELNYRKRFRQFDCSINPLIFQGFLKIFRFTQFHIGVFGKYAQHLSQSILRNTGKAANTKETLINTKHQ